jgi:GT2 family glycosyltransferase
VKIEIISATRQSEADFQGKSPLGVSLRRLSFDRNLGARIAASNSRGLPHVYNAALEAVGRDSIAVFMHDDVWIDDHFFRQRIVEGLQSYDVIGIAGNRRRVPEQPGWAFVDRQFTWDRPEQLSGAVAHAQHPFGRISFFGESPAPCELLDGVLLAARKSVLLESRTEFDPRFDFHFYDMDFCRSARQKGLKLGTWPICLTHQSAGAYGTERWTKAYHTYLDKWGS